MIDLNNVAEAIREAYFRQQANNRLFRGDHIPWSDLPEHRKEKWLVMAQAAVQVVLA